MAFGKPVLFVNSRRRIAGIQSLFGGRSRFKACFLSEIHGCWVI